MKLFSLKSGHAMYPGYRAYKRRLAHSVTVRISALNNLYYLLKVLSLKVLEYTKELNCMRCYVLLSDESLLM